MKEYLAIWKDTDPGIRRPEFILKGVLYKNYFTYYSYFKLINLSDEFTENNKTTVPLECFLVLEEIN